MRPNSHSRSTVAPAPPRRVGSRRRDVSKRALDLAVAIALLVVIAPLVLVVAVAIKIEGRGPVFYRCRRAGQGGPEFAMLKFRKMFDGARGPALTAPNDARFTRVGRFLARTKLDEIPQLVNVLRGEMSLVGPRPEDPEFVRVEPEKFATVLAVRPGITGLSQLAFAREGEILDPSNRIEHYLGAILPQKLALDALYTRQRSIRMDVAILAWTAFAVIARRDVAVNRATGQLTRREPRSVQPVAAESS